MAGIACKGSHGRAMKGVVGVVGLGIMGGAMAQNLVAAGWRVIGFDIDAARRSELAEAGVAAALAPSLTRGSIFSGERFHTTRS